MELIVTVAGREERVRIEERAGDDFEIRVGTTIYEVDAVSTGPHRLSLRTEGRQFEVSVSPGADGVYRVGSRRGSDEVRVMDPLTHLAEEAGPGAGGPRVEAITAYMPGRVVTVLVEEGQEVETGEGLVVLEAMKMENEIQADHPATVRRICVQEGQAVEGGDVLLELV
ncbi:MAG: biotin/lipoyl-containing protein [Thermoanaerobaculia bacterium]|nr:biotin/lipoyl-containing protein [Thermoanaerobaculia bacterium]